MGESKSFFTKVFGGDIGEIVQVFAGFFLVIGFMMGMPLLIMFITSPTSKDVSYKEILSNSREITKNIYKELAKYDSLTTKIDRKIDRELLEEKGLINQKRELLIELQKDFDSIYLTPQQLSILSAVRPKKENISFRAWITSTNQLYNIGVSLVISFFFYYLGRKKGKQIIN